MVVVVPHENTDLDALASAIGLSYLIKDSFLYIPKRKEKEVAEFLKSYKKDLPLNFLEEKDLEELAYIQKLIIADTSDLERIPEEILKKINKEKTLIYIFDHHKDEKGYEKYKKEGYKIYVKKVETGSCSSIVAHLYERKKNFSPPKIILNTLLLGVYSDTGSFRYSGTSSYDFEAASILMKLGADINFIQKCLSYLEKITKEDLDFITLFKDNLNILDIKGKKIGIINLPNLQKTTGELATKLSKFFEIETDLDAVFLLTNIDKKRNVIIARSRDEEIDVGYILRKKPLEGGGHSSAASATVTDIAISELETVLREILFDIYYKDTLLVKNFMSSPPKCVYKDMPIKDAIDLFEKYSFSFLPVLDSNGNPFGLLTRSLVDKFKQFGDIYKEKVGDYCERDIETIYEDDTLYKAYLLFSKRNPPMLIVKNKEEKVVGVLTKSDLTIYEDEFYKFVSRNKKIKNISQKLKSVLRKKVVNGINLLDFIEEIGKLAQDLGIRAYIVGGFIRDLFLERENFDIDIVVEGDAKLLLKKIKEKFKLKTHFSPGFKSGKVFLAPNFHIDINTARAEYYKKAGALPKIEQASLKKDLYRRDFTINTLACDISPNNFGYLLDFFGGLEDIKERKIRVLHSLSFIEDPTRILRAFRFLVRYRFEFGKQTEYLIKQAISLHVLDKVEGSRIYHELKMIFLEDNPLRVIRKLYDYGVLKELSKDISFNEGKARLFENLRKMIIWHKITAPNEKVDYSIPYFAAFLWNMPFEKAKNILEKWCPPENEKRLIFLIFDEAVKVAKKLEKVQKNSEIYELLKNYPNEFLLFLGAYNPELKKKISYFILKLKSTKNVISGRDLLELGFPQSKIMSFTLKKIFHKVLDKEIACKEEALEYIKSNKEKIFEEFENLERKKVEVKS